MSAAKIRLSKKETGLLADAEWILTKNRIIREVVAFLSDWQQEQQPVVSKTPLLVPGWQFSSPKISRGENYLGLPWVVLDYPRDFAHPGFAAIRVLCWWGKFFSLTLHASDRFKEQLAGRILNCRDALAGNGFYVCVNPEEWHHHFEQFNYRPIAGMDLPSWEACIHEKKFLKISACFPIGDTDKLPEELTERFRFLVDLLRN